MGEASKAAIPETMEGLRRQNSAYRALCASLEQTQARQTELGRKYQEAVTTLDSERAANAILTEEVAALSAQVEELREGLEQANAAIAEYYRYWTGGETRGSYDGKPERAGLWNAHYAARILLAKHKEAEA